tara:strand:- start:251 stop:1099 length:849 start_codon:yes stop_codon:yes gene_type:complete
MEQDYYIKNNFSKFIEISGQDRATFLQGLITNDIRKCKDIKNSIYSCLLSPQGKFLADFFIVNLNNHYLIEINEKFFESFFSKLKIYKLRSKVEFNVNKDLISLIFFTKNINNINNINNNILFTDPRNAKLGYKSYINKKSNNLEMISKFKEYTYDFYKIILMQNLVPNSINDLIENKSLLLENNFQNINAIDWEKGCYIGQEITARMKYRALLKKQIYILELISGNINQDEDIVVKNINIGNVISKLDKYVLCMLKINFAEDKNLNKKQIKTDSSTELKFL